MGPILQPGLSAMAGLPQVGFAIPSFEPWEVLWAAVLWLATWLLPTCALFYLVYFCVTLPLRRRERARFFLDLLETGLRQGRRAEEALVSMAESRDRSPGVRFHLLAAHLEKGLRLSAALEAVPRLVPPRVAAMLKVGEQIGGYEKVLPACRQTLKDAVSQMRGAFNYLILLLVVITPLGWLVLLALSGWVLPKFSAIADEFEMPVSPWLVFLQQHQMALGAAPITLVLFLWLAAFCYVGGPRLAGWLQAGIAPVVDWLHYRLPWRRKRMQRDFSAMLAVLLDAGVPEDQAVLLAAGCTANDVFVRRAEKVVLALRRGVKLTEAVQGIDDTGEFRWRLTNACHAQSGFAVALAGWHDALDAKAFQQEQAAAQSVTTLMVLLNGVFVGLIVVSVFHVLVSILQAAVLW